MAYAESCLKYLNAAQHLHGLCGGLGCQQTQWQREVNAFWLPPTTTNTVSDAPLHCQLLHLFITTTAQWGIKAEENGDRLLKNIYTLSKINNFLVKLGSDRDYPLRVKEMVVFRTFVTSASGAARRQLETR